MEAVIRSDRLVFMTAEGLTFERPSRAAPKQRRKHTFASDDSIREFLEISDLGAVMRDGVAPPEMLLDGWLQRGVLHWLQGEPEDGKSWVAAWCAAEVIRSRRDAKVLWMDSEMGQRTMAERLEALGLNARAVDEQFVHVSLSLLPRVGFDAFREWVTDHRFDLIVWDSMAQHFAGADVDDDRSNSGIAWWIAELVNPVSAYGGTTVCVDHVTKAGGGGGYARGGGAKKARSRIVYEFDKVGPFDRTRVGAVRVVCEKNSDAADVPARRTVQLGGTPFTFREHAEAPEAEREEAQAERLGYRQRLLATLEHQARVNPAEPRLSLSKWVELTPGKAARLREAAKELLHHPAIERGTTTYAPAVKWVQERVGGRDLVYVWVDVPQPGTAENPHGD